MYVSLINFPEGKGPEKTLPCSSVAENREVGKHRVGGGREGELGLEKGQGPLRLQYPSRCRMFSHSPDGTGGGSARLGM